MITPTGKQLTTSGAEVGPSMWGITSPQLKQLGRNYPTVFDRTASVSARDFVNNHVKRDYRGGRGVALTFNDGDPKEVGIMISHCWDETMSAFLRDVLIMTDDHDTAGMFICFLALYQGTDPNADDDPEVKLQVEQGSTDINKGCFAEVLNSVAKNGGPMVVISNDAVCSTGGLYSRLWCVWEVHCALEDDVEILMHPRTSTELHLFGTGGKGSFDPKKNARCGKPGSKITDDEISIRRTIDGPTAGPGKWPTIKDQILDCSKYTTKPSRMEADSCRLGHRGVNLLLELMAEDPSKYTKLDLSRNGIGDHTAQVLAAALHHNTTLTSVSLRHNKIGDGGAQALAAALRHNTTLEYVWLGSNNIGEGGAKALNDVSLATGKRCVVLWN
eukprot:NODE_700_length_1400_cov_310.871375.p1 GENE.NODE_700_length_1400_cov_310.871375~~NODE_700_length_1400_cov_310.871375.p1  ORF type:complete len:436 (+),score=119.01 NODE_700_length_1400_cov_310.871375:150-1310(+)